MRATDFIAELVNTEILKPGFKDETTILNGKYILRAEVESDDDGKSLLTVSVFDPKGDAPKYRIAFGRFRIKRRWFENHLVASIIMVQDEYQKQGIATAIYQYIRKLGNTIKPSFVQLGPGKEMWKSFKKTGALRELDQSL